MKKNKACQICKTNKMTGTTQRLKGYKVVIDICLSCWEHDKAKYGALVIDI